MNAIAYFARYQGCSIVVHNNAMMDGKAHASYEIVADSPEAIAAFAAHGITRLHATIDTTDESYINLRLFDRRDLVEMAKCDIDFILEVGF